MEETEKSPFEKKGVKKEPVKKEITKQSEDTFIMRVTHLSWGYNKMNHFYAEKKPLISKKVMGKKYESTLDIWLKNGWIEEGSYL